MTPMPVSRGRLPRYALWQASDYALERGVPALIVGILLMLGPVLGIQSMGGRSAIGSDMATMIFSQVLGGYALFGALFATNGIIANDRTHGYFRFLFAKPVRVAQFYAQAFLIHGVGLLGITVAVFAIFAAGVRPIPEALAGTVIFVAAVYLAFGGIAFLASALVRFDWLVALALWGSGILARQLAVPGESWWSTALHALLPPSHLSEHLRAELLAGRVPSGPLLWFAGYGVVAVALGLVVLRRRGLAG